MTAIFVRKTGGRFGYRNTENAQGSCCMKVEVDTGVTDPKSLESHDFQGSRSEEDREGVFPKAFGGNTILPIP